MDGPTYLDGMPNSSASQWEEKMLPYLKRKTVDESLFHGYTFTSRSHIRRADRLPDGKSSRSRAVGS